MLFTSFHFILLFFPLILIISRSLKGQMLLIWITVSSYLFYAMEGQPWFLLPMLVTTVLDFFLAQWIEQTATPRRRRGLLILSLCGNLGMLCVFKYSKLFYRTLQGLANLAGSSWLSNPPPLLAAIILPAGISFYTFQTLSYILDVYRGEARAEKNFWKFSSFVSFFPHLVAGPLTRHHQLLPQLENLSQDGVRPRWGPGVYLFSIGLAKKVLADRFGDQVTLLLRNGAPHSFAPAWFALFGYALQIYFDFSGYSDMAIGLGRLLGVELPQNFNSPYKATSPSDFWRRWHITLSQWFRDYVYIPLGGSRVGWRRQILNAIVTMALVGLWHGAQYTFIAWGLYHAVLLILYHGFKGPWERLPLAIQRSITFMGVTLGWVFFRSDSFGFAANWFRALFQVRWISSPAVIPGGVLALLIAGLLIVQYAPNASREMDFTVVSPPRQVVLGLLVVCAVYFMNRTSYFLYYQF